MPRPHFAYLFERFPSFTQTFCAREVLELERQGTKLQLFSIRSTGDEAVRHFPEELTRRVITLPAAEALTREVEAMKQRRELPQSVVLTLRGWGGRPDKMRLYEAAWTGHRLRQAGVRHVHTHFAGLAARTAWWIRQFYGLSYSFTGHANDLFCPDENTGLTLPLLIQDAAAVIAVSDYTAEWLRREHPSSAARIHRVYNGMDLESVTAATRPAPQPAPASPKPGKSSPPLIYSVGRLIEKKGFEVLIAACALLKDAGVPFQCRITGEGPLIEELTAQIETSQLTAQVILTGPLSQAQILENLGMAAVFALPCVTESGGGRDVLPTVIMEAMAAGLPCVSTRVAGVPEMVIDHQTGLLTAERDPAATAAALATLLKSPELATQYGKAGLDLARERFEKSRTARQLRRILVANTKINGLAGSPSLAPARLQRIPRTFSKTLRPPHHGKNPVFPSP